MKGKLITTLLLITIGLLAPLTAGAHDLSKHKGRQTKGEILSVSQDRFELKTSRGTQPVLLSEKPKIEKGDQPGSAADLRKGEQVTVIGTTLASGELVAREVIIGASTASQKKTHSTAPAHNH